MRRLSRLTALVVAALAAPTTASAAAPPGEHSPNLTFVKNLRYAAHNGGTPNFGTDIEFANIDGRRYALAGSYKNGMQIVDITNPANARIVSRYDCGVTQGDIQVFRQSSKPGRVFVGYASDTYGDGTSTCYREAERLGFYVRKPNGTGKNGTFIAEITDPLRPITRSFVEVPQGSHNHSIHPGGSYLYNSNSDLITSPLPAIEVYDIRDFLRPRLVTEIALPTRPGLGTESHDITFNRSGSRAYSAALSQGVIIDTTKPAAPTLLTSFLDPTINVWHQMDPFTLTDASGIKRDFLIAEDEFVGAVGTSQCPNGGVHIYDITGANEQNPVKVGYWNIDDVRPTDEPEWRCTAHVLDVHEGRQVMTIAWYNGGVHVVDLSGLASGEGMRRIGRYKVDGGESWSAKTPGIEPSGDFYLYSNDIQRGLDIFRFDRQGDPSSPGTWMSPAAYERFAASKPRVSSDYKLACLL